MDTWKFFDITHREHTFCNPMSEEKFSQLIDLLRLEPESRVLEIAAGKGEFIIRLAEQYRISGVGVDKSPFCIADARRKQAQRLTSKKISFVEMDGADYTPETPRSFHLAACIGASWIFSGHRGTLEALKRLVVPGGWIVVGEPFWRKEPPAEYISALGEDPNTYGTHHQNVVTGEEMGLVLVYTLLSDVNDWDKYEGLQWYAAENWIRSHPSDPDVDELQRRISMNKEIYLKWGRDTLGWGIYVFRKKQAEKED